VKIFDDSVGAVCRRQAAPPPAPPRAIGIVLKTKPVRWFDLKKPEPKPSPVF
jgi:hypothetical protein